MLANLTITVALLFVMFVVIVEVIAFWFDRTTVANISLAVAVAIMLAWLLPGLWQLWR